MKILVVDDEKLIREVIKEYLLNDNYEVIEKPIEEETTNESLEELSKEELIERLKELSND